MEDRESADKDHETYVQRVSGLLELNPDYFVTVIKSCQKLFIDEMRLENTVAKNDALMD